jgi:hypothetical protein
VDGISTLAEINSRLTNHARANLTNPKITVLFVHEIINRFAGKPAHAFFSQAVQTRCAAFPNYRRCIRNDSRAPALIVQ